MTQRPSRREILKSCAGHLATAALLAPASRIRAWAQPTNASIVVREPFGYLQQVADGIWALISTPLPLLAEITLRSASVGPPIVLPEAP